MPRENILSVFTNVLMLIDRYWRIVGNWKAIVEGLNSTSIIECEPLI